MESQLHQALPSTMEMHKSDNIVPVVSEPINDLVPEQNRDVLELARVGKRQVLKRRFGLLSMTGFSCTLTITWEGMLTDFSLGLSNGGPAGLIYGYLIAWLGMLSVFIAMGELSSMIPTAGGQYHWVSVLAPKRVRSFLGYITGWSTTISWVAGSTAVSYFAGTLLQNVIALNHPSYNPTGWQGTLMMWAVLLLATAITTAFGKVLPTIEVILFLLHVLGFFGTMIPLAYYAGSRGNVQARSQEIFTAFYNFGGWPTQTLSFLIGIQGNVGALLGIDGAIHMSEEVEKSSINVARSIIYSVLINGALGFAMLLCVLFAADDLEALAQSSSRYPIIDLLAGSLNNFGGATAIVVLLSVMNMASTIGTLSSAGRMMWSFARDRGLPGWRWLRKVNKHTSVPFNATFVAAAIALLLGLINIGSSTVFNDVISLTLEGFFMSYLFAISQLLYRRIRGDILEPDEDLIRNSNESMSSEDIIDQYTWGPWRLKGWIGILNNIFALVYLLVIGFFAFWPSVSAVTAANMDYACLVLGVVMLGSVIWYFAKGNQEFSGPIVEIKVS